MPDETLLALGFVRKKSPYSSSDDNWTHRHLPETFYYHVLTPSAVEEILIQIGAILMRRRACAEVQSVDVDRLTGMT